MSVKIVLKSNGLFDVSTLPRDAKYVGIFWGASVFPDRTTLDVIWKQMIPTIGAWRSRPVIVTDFALFSDAVDLCFGNISKIYVLSHMAISPNFFNPFALSTSNVIDVGVLEGDASIENVKEMIERGVIHRSYDIALYADDIIDKWDTVNVVAKQPHRWTQTSLIVRRNRHKMIRYHAACVTMMHIFTRVYPSLGRLFGLAFLDRYTNPNDWIAKWGMSADTPAYATKLCQEYKKLQLIRTDSRKLERLRRKKARLEKQLASITNDIEQETPLAPVKKARYEEAMGQFAEIVELTKLKRFK
jgi:hypothetical protein